MSYTFRTNILKTFAQHVAGISNSSPRLTQHFPPLPVVEVAPIVFLRIPHHPYTSLIYSPVGE